MKYFRMSYEEVVFRRSYINILLLCRSIPESKVSDEEKDKEKNSKPSKLRHDIDKPISANDFFMGMMG